MPTHHELAWIVSTLRKLQGITLLELAKKNGVERPNLSAWFAGRTKVISEVKQLRICEFLGWRFDQLICSQLHMWRIASDEDMKLLLEFLRSIVSPEKNRLVIVTAGIGNTLVGNLLFLATKGGEGTLIRLRRAARKDLSLGLTKESLGFGDTTVSHSMSEEEYEAVWRNEATTIQTATYVERYLTEDPIAHALHFDSNDWSAEAITEVSRQNSLDDFDTRDQSLDEEPQDYYPLTDKEEWLLSETGKLWLEFGWECASAGFSVQDAMRWKEMALKNRS